MDENRKKVLDMVANGKITVEEAEKLLDRLSSEAAGVPVRKVSEDASVPAAERPVPKNPQFLRVVVASSGGDQVNVRVPMALVRTGIKMGALLPQQARQQMEAHGLDLSALSQLNPDELVEALGALTVDVDSGNGDKVRVFCE